MREGENVRLGEPHILSPALWDRVRDRKKMCGSSSRTLSCFVEGDTREGENVRLEEPHISPSCDAREGTREAENVRFEEPHVLCAVSYATVWDRQREMCGSKNRAFLSPVLWEMVCERKRECAAPRATHSPSCVVGESMREEEDHAALRAAHSLFSLVGDGTREEGRTCGS